MSLSLPGGYGEGKCLGSMLYSFFIKVVRFLASTGLGLSRFPLVMPLYRFLYRALLPRERVILIPVQEHKMYVNIGDTGRATQDLISEGVFFKQMTTVVKNIITEGMVCLDIGANIGYFTLIMARLVGEGGRVFAFEPEPHNFDLLVKNIALNGYDNITPVPKAISNRDGRSKLFLDRTSFGANSLVRQNVPDIGQDTVEVEVQTLDSFFKDYDGKVDFIKMHVEGAELTVLEGMEDILNKNKNLIIITRFLPSLLAGFGSPPEEYLNRLVGQGFKLYDISEPEEGVYLTDVASILKQYPPGEGTNLLAKR